MKRKYGKRPNISLLLKINHKEKLIQNEMETDRANFEKSFRNSKMSDLQKYLNSLHKTRSLPVELYLETNDKHQPKHVRTTDNFQKSELINQFYCRVFNADGQIPPDRNYRTADLNYVKITEHEIKETLIKLDIKKHVNPTTLGT